MSDNQDHQQVEGSTTTATRAKKQKKNTRQSSVQKANKRQRTKSATLPPKNLLLPPFMMERISKELLQDDPERASVCLLELAQLFRRQSALCLQQAERLDGSTMEEDVRPSRFSLSQKLDRQNVLCMVDKSADLMLETQQMLDTIESRLVPYRDVR